MCNIYVRTTIIFFIEKGDAILGVQSVLENNYTYLKVKIRDNQS